MTVIGSGGSDDANREHANDAARAQRHRSRVDARLKATGSTRFVGDVTLPGMLYAAVNRSPFPSARIRAVDAAEALALPGVVAVYTSEHVSTATYGRFVRDIPILARGVVRFAGEKVAAVLAESRVLAERAASLVAVEYEELPAVTTPEQALDSGAPSVHESPWNYPRAICREDWGPNVQSLVTDGDRTAVEEALSRATHVVSATYTTPAGHQGYLEPWSCVAEVELSGRIRLWLTNKSPYRLTTQLAECLGVSPGAISVEPGALGGDFGGKGSPEDAPLCVELSRLCGRPVKLTQRYSEDLVATNPRHSSRVHVELGADGEGGLMALSCRSVLDGGAYAGYKPSPTVSLHGMLDVPGYRLPAYFLESRIAYTNNVPKGHMRAPGGPQMTFALESAIDELASVIGLAPEELRRRNLLRRDEPDAKGHRWLEQRGLETLEAALSSRVGRPAPHGWLRGSGLAVYRRETGRFATSLRLLDVGGHRLRAEVPVVETGAGSHSVVRDLLAEQLGYSPEEVDVVQVESGALPQDGGASDSRVTASISAAVEQAAKAWPARRPGAPVDVVVDQGESTSVGSYCVQLAQVAVDPATGQVAVLDVLTAVDVARIVEPAAHQMQIDGGTTQGVGFGLLEDLLESEGQVWAANLGEFKIPSARDVPPYRTVLVPDGTGLGAANVKNIGELTTPPTAAAIANAVAAATGCRLRDLPLRAERVYWALQARSQGTSGRALEPDVASAGGVTAGSPDVRRAWR